MIKERHILSGLFIMIAAMIIAAAGFAYVSAESSTEEPIRAVHMVTIDDKQYCFFVKNNVVLTPEDLVDPEKDPETGEEMPISSKDLTDRVFNDAGLYMKESNCNEKSHSAIKIEDFENKGVRVSLRDDDIELIRNAGNVVRSEKNPVKLYIDLVVTAEGKAPITVSKAKSPSILFIAIVTQEDKEKEEICKAIKEEESQEQTPVTQPAQPVAKTKKPKVPKVPEVKEDPLPEFRTIKMTDRSGGPLEETLKDGDPVTLKWIEPGHKADAEGKTGFFSHLPGKILGLVFIALALAAILLAIIVARRKDTT